MKSIVRSLLLLSTLPFMVTAAPVPDMKKVDFSGGWVNQRGSTLVLQKEDETHYKGTFTTAVAETETCIGKPVPVQAIRNDNALALSLSMASCGSKASISITGLLTIDDQGSEAIDTMALTVWSGKENWKSRIVTHDSYQRIGKMAASSNE